MAGCETGQQHHVKMEHNLTGTLAEAWEDMGSSDAFVTSQRHSVYAQIPGSTLGLLHGIVTLGSVIQPPHLAFLS